MFGYQGQLHFADHFDEKMVQIGQAVQKIWQREKRYGNLKRRVEDQHEGIVWLSGTRYILLIIFIKIVKIGQTVQKIWQGEGRLCVQFAMFLWKSLTKSK